MGVATDMRPSATCEARLLKGFFFLPPRPQWFGGACAHAAWGWGRGRGGEQGQGRRAWGRGARGGGGGAPVPPKFRSIFFILSPTPKISQKFSKVWRLPTCRQSVGPYPTVVRRSSLSFSFPFSSLVLNTTSVVPNLSTPPAAAYPLSIANRPTMSMSAPSSRSPSPKPVLPPSSAEEVVQPAISSLSAIPAAPTADRFPSVSSHFEPVVMLDPSHIYI